MEIKVVCFGYSRKSPDDKENTETSIANQNELIVNICKKNSWELLKIISDKNISGSDRGRKGINQVIQEAIAYKKNVPDVEVYIVIKDSKRFARDGAWATDRLKDLNAYRVFVFTIIENKVLDPSDLGVRIIANVNEQTIWDGKKNAEILQEQKISKNLPCIPAPFGYKYNDDKEWQVVKREAKIVQEVIRGFIDNEKYSDAINRLKINKSLYYRIIKTCKKGLYSGWIIFENKTKDSMGNLVRVEEVKYPGSHPAIISKELFDKINSVK